MFQEGISRMEKVKESKLTPCVDLPLAKSELREIVEKAKDWALLNGMLFRTKKRFSKDEAPFVPFVLLPSSFPRREFESACRLQLILNQLMHSVAHDYDFLKQCLRDAVEVDPFTAKLFRIYETVREEGFAQKVSLAILRSDLMLEIGEDARVSTYRGWKQVEINSIASGFGWFGPAAGQLHNYVLRELGLESKMHNMPENDALQGLCGAMIEAWKIYNDPRSVILFVIEDVTYNICDQRFHEFEIRRQRKNIGVLRRTLTQLADEAVLGDEKELLVNGTAVAVVYFRCGYEPEHYHGNREWNVRLLMERSRAIKCPSIQYQLAGLKKIQQALATPGTTARFLKCEEIAARVQRIFTTLPNVLHAVPKYEVGHEAREIYIFREGTVVMWNIPELESGNILQFLKPYEEGSYAKAAIQAENEMMSYTYAEPGKKSHLKDGDIYLATDATSLDKYTFSNAIAQSVKLGIWEGSLDRYIDSIEFVTEDLKAGRKIKMTREEVLRKQGELFALRHLINLSSDLLDTPDFYWERDELEALYHQTCSYFSIAKRTKVMNDKINHCIELVELLSSHLSDRHHVRLEWMIIVLIMVEVGFETLHYIDRYFAKQESDSLFIT